MKEINELIEISRFYGSDTRYVIAGGGNTSYKNNDQLWVKASGSALSVITEEGFAILNREKLAVISTRKYSADTAARENEVKEDLATACITKDRRPSVETSLHNAIKASFVVHLHPTMVNALTCANNAESKTAELFGTDVLYIPYIDPGYILFKEVETRLAKYTETYGKEPKAIILQNHGIFVGGNTIQQIKDVYDEILGKIEKSITKNISADKKKVCECAKEIVPAIRMIAGGKSAKVINSDLVEHFNESESAFEKISRPFTPDIIVYCKSNYIYCADKNIDKIEKQITDYTSKFGYAPKVVFVKGIGMVALGDNAAACNIVEEVFEDMMKIAVLSESFGGPHPMTKAQIDFIDNWEVENYRRKVSAGASAGRAENKIIIVTGAAQGFGEGIAACLASHGANIVIADLNETVGTETAAKLNATLKSNKAIFVKTNVADTESLNNLVHETVCNFGGIDVFVSNAGVLRAGDLDDMTPENFEFVTKINYTAYFYCAKAVSPVMKLQNKYKPDNYCDIIQINSKSGLRGSKANFAYAGGKFGGIGLTQSFALELAPFRIKVNSICPGNFYEGPLWSDSENGLFVQYLKAGKVPGAKTIEDVKQFYMAQVPMGKGTNPNDVTKAVLYLIEQTCETGQAIPITGGQVMLN